METDYTTESAVKKNLLSAIEGGKVSMRPRWHFITRSILAAVGAVFLVMWVFYLASLIMFSLRKTGALQMPAYGSYGWYEFFWSLPWLFILVSVIALLLLEAVMRRYAFAYRQPVLYSFAAILFVAACGAIVVDRMEVHSYIRSFSELHGLGPVTSFYQDLDRNQEVFFMQGGVVQNGTDDVIVSEVNGNLTHVIFDAETMFPDGREFATSDMVVIFGNRMGDTVHAHGLRLLLQ